MTVSWMMKKKSMKMMLVLLPIPFIWKAGRRRGGGWIQHAAVPLFVEVHCEFSGCVCGKSVVSLLCFCFCFAFADRFFSSCFLSMRRKYCIKKGTDF